MVVIFAIAAGILSPPDVLSMLCVWIPMMALYEIGIILVALVVHPYLKRKHMGTDIEKPN